MQLQSYTDVNSMTYKNVIWEGRYQPIHRGHVAYVRRLLRSAERVWIVVVANEVSSEPDELPLKLPVPKFTAIVDPHHSPDKNPLPFWLRLLLVQETIRSELGADAPVVVWGGRRMDLAWSLYRKILPPDRVFVTPERDDFEDAKAEAWKLLGERVERVDVSDLPRISGTQIRQRVTAGETVSDLLYPRTEALLRELGFFDRLRAI